MLIDVATGSTALLRQVLRLGLVVIVVLRPDMASIVSLQVLRELIDQLSAEAGRSIELFYLLNQFDASLRRASPSRARRYSAASMCASTS